MSDGSCTVCGGNSWVLIRYRYECNYCGRRLPLLDVSPPGEEWRRSRRAVPYDYPLVLCNLCGWYRSNNKQHVCAPLDTGEGGA